MSLGASMKPGHAGQFSLSLSEGEGVAVRGPFFPSTSGEASFRFFACLGTIILTGACFPVPASGADLPAPPMVVVHDVLVDGDSQKPSLENSTQPDVRTEPNSGEPVNLGRLRISPRAQRLEFKFGPNPASSNQPVRFRYQLEGFDRDWQEAGGEMRLTVKFLDSAQNTVGAVDFVARGESPGWAGNAADSRFVHRREPLIVPPQAAAMQIELFSGGDEQTTGLMAIDDLAVWVAGSTNDKPAAALFSSRFAGERGFDPRVGVPSHWMRDGSKPSIARMLNLNDTEARHVLAVVDTDAAKWGAWRTDLASSVPVRPGDSLILAWSEIYSIGWGGTRTATYTYLAPGTYHFRVRAVTETGEWTGEAASLLISCPPPFWKRSWFLGSSLAVAVGVLVMGVRHATSRKMEARLEMVERQRALERERARIARDLHDDLGASLTQIALLSELAKADLAHPEQATAHLNQIFTKTGVLARQLNEIVWAVNPANDTLEHFTSHICKFAQDYLSLAGIRCRLDFPESVPGYPMLSPERHNLFLTAKEALHNVVKHAQAGQVWLRLKLAPGALTLLIEDDGKGWDADTLAGSLDHPTGDGLSNMQKRMEQLGGRFAQQSKPGSGTSVRLELPLRKL
ncbi:MAG TPA: ATP-binding protein [Candidatus Binatia bacterium]|jgi:signal transduction histidine kinase|nr:ATP-binding protein [Candidatus Binatia bacterium]